MFVELYVHLDEIKCMWFWKDKEPNETNFIWKKLSHFATIPNIIRIFLWYTLLDTNTIGQAHNESLSVIGSFPKVSKNQDIIYYN